MRIARRVRRAARGNGPGAIRAPRPGPTQLAGSANSERGAARLVTDAIMVARAFAATGLVIVRADSAYYAREVIAAATWAGAKFSITARMTPLVRAPISSTDDDAWVPISYPTPASTTTSSSASPTPRSPSPPTPRPRASAKSGFSRSGVV